MERKKVLLSQKFSLGQRVQVRDAGQEWSSGVVTQVDPIKVKKDYWTTAYVFDEVRIPNKGSSRSPRQDFLEARRHEINSTTSPSRRQRMLADSPPRGRSALSIRIPTQSSERDAGVPDYGFDLVPEAEEKSSSRPWDRFPRGAAVLEGITWQNFPTAPPSQKPMFFNHLLDLANDVFCQVIAYLTAKDVASLMCVSKECNKLVLAKENVTRILLNQCQLKWMRYGPLDKTCFLETGGNQSKPNARELMYLYAGLAPHPSRICDNIEEPELRVWSSKQGRPYTELQYTGMIGGDRAVRADRPFPATRIHLEGEKLIGRAVEVLVNCLPANQIRKAQISQAMENRDRDHSEMPRQRPGGLRIRGKIVRYHKPVTEDEDEDEMLISDSARYMVQMYITNALGGTETMKSFVLPHHIQLLGSPLPLSQEITPVRFSTLLPIVDDTMHGLSPKARQMTGNTGNYVYHLGWRNVAYYEVTVAERDEEYDKMECVSLGLATDKFPLLGRQVGWNPDSFGWHSDDGGLFHCSGLHAKNIETFGPGDTVGCGVDYYAAEGYGNIFFTKNGKFILTAFREVNCAPLYPTIGVDTNSTISFNFGYEPFKYDILQHMRKRPDDKLSVRARNLRHDFHGMTTLEFWDMLEDDDSDDDFQPPENWTTLSGANSSAFGNVDES